MKPTPKNASAGSRPRPGKPISKTVEMLRINEQLKRAGKGKEKAVLRGLHDVVQVHSNLPGAVQVERFAEARALEVAALQSAAKTAAASNTSRAFQSLPRHLRRRAASHNPRRVPKYLKERAAAEIDPGDNIVKLQRRKAKLRARGNSKGLSRTQQLRLRQRGKAWLATHMFHAKRFHMTNKWGYRLPRTPTLKSFRSSYRAARRRVCFQDTSYFGVIELESTREPVLELLGSLVGATPFAGTRFEEGSHSAHVNLYAPGQFPRCLIGPAELLWLPSQSARATVWVRVHPSIFQETWAALACPLVQRRDLRTELESFDIMGPLSGSTILRSLPFSSSESEENRQAIISALTGDAAAVPNGLTLSFTAVDPRLSFPPCHQYTTTRGVSHGPTPQLWARDCRLQLSKPTFTKSELDERRRQSGIPGQRLAPTERDDYIPVMLIKRQVGTIEERNATFHGFSVVFPKGWSMALLPSFAYCGAKLVGISESEVQHREAGVPSFPEHYGSVCLAAKDHENAQAKEAERRWLRKPPGKRTEFSALNVGHPFKPDWNELINPNGTMLDLWLLESALGHILERLAHSEDPAVSLLAAINTFRRRRGMHPIPDEDAASLFQSCLCHVQVDVLGRGSPSDMAMIYKMSAEERSKWLQALDKVDPDWFSAEELREEWNKPIGFVSTGNISLTRGKGHGLATIPVSAYLDLLRMQDPQSPCAIVLVRNRNSLTCRIAALRLVQTP